MTAALPSNDLRDAVEVSASGLEARLPGARYGREAAIHHTASSVVGSDDAVYEHQAMIAAFKAADGAAPEAGLRQHFAAARVRLRGSMIGAEAQEARLRWVGA